jgi:hypothetical protein
MSRARNPMSETSQLRVDEVPVEVLSMLDAVSMADGDRSRGPLVIRILQKWARAEARKHTLISRVLASNQVIEDLAGMDAE